MEKRVLMVATVPSMIGQFNMNNIRILLELGYEVDVAADFTDTSVWTRERIDEFKNTLKEMGVAHFHINFSRSPFKLIKHIEAYKKSVGIIESREYSFVHTHTPIASAIIRLATHKTGTKVMYTAHGFHFYKGAPIKNWITFYPVEKWLSRYTDTLITINKEDYNRARGHFSAKRTEYIPGVGIDLERFEPSPNARMKIREELGIDESQTMILSVGELNINKNHISVIKALSGIAGITYVVVGKGELSELLQTTAKDYGVNLILAGYRNDVADFYNAADIYVHPSFREGLPVSLMEAMASGLPVACSRIRGNTDLVDNTNCNMLFDPKKPEDIRSAIESIMTSNQDRKISKENLEAVKDFSIDSVRSQMKEVYGII